MPFTKSREWPNGTRIKYPGDLAKVLGCCLGHGARTLPAHRHPFLHRLAAFQSCPPPRLRIFDSSPHKTLVSTTDLYTSIFDANPSAMFVVTADLSIREFNDAAVELPEDVLLHAILPDGESNKIGDALGCFQATLGCGNSPGCQNCSLANSVHQAADGKPCRKVLSMRVTGQGEIVSVEYFMTIAPLRHGEESLALLVLDNTADWFPGTLSNSRAARA